MILLDADVLLLDLRYKNDVRYPVNQAALQRLRDSATPAGMTSQALLEVVGVLSFNIRQADVAALPNLLCVQYRLNLLPHPDLHPDYAGCGFAEIVVQLTHQMSLGDAVQAVQVQRFASPADCLLSWNAKHFAGKLVIPVLTPADWLTQQDAT